MKWTEEQTINFVTEYIKYECLYNTSCAEHRNKQLRKAALLKISKTIDIIDFGPKEVYQKIRSLKSTYSQELKKIKCSQSSGAGTSDIYTPRVKWFNILHDALTAVNNTGEWRETSGNFETVYPLELQKVEYDEFDNATSSNEERTAASEATPQANNDSLIIHKCINVKKEPKKRRFKGCDKQTKVQNTANSVANPLEQSENEFDIFGKSVAAQLKNMPLDMAIEAQMFMQNYLSELRLRTFQRTMYNSQCLSSSDSN